MATFVVSASTLAPITRNHVDPAKVDEVINALDVAGVTDQEIEAAINSGSFDVLAALLPAFDWDSVKPATPATPHQSTGSSSNRAVERIVTQFRDAARANKYLAIRGIQLSRIPASDTRKEGILGRMTYTVAEDDATHTSIVGVRSILQNIVRGRYKTNMSAQEAMEILLTAKGNGGIIKWEDAFETLVLEQTAYCVAEIEAPDSRKNTYELVIGKQSEGSPEAVYQQFCRNNGIQPVDCDIRVRKAGVSASKADINERKVNYGPSDMVYVVPCQYRAGSTPSVTIYSTNVATEQEFTQKTNFHGLNEDQKNAVRMTALEKAAEADVAGNSLMSRFRAVARLTSEEHATKLLLEGKLPA